MLKIDISKVIADMKKEPGFTDKVGMILVHNGIVRGWSRKNHENITAINVQPDLKKMEKICNEFEKREGIYKVLAFANSGELKPGDDLLFLFVAGDIRENVKPALSELLDTIKSEAVIKKEFFED